MSSRLSQVVASVQKTQVDGINRMSINEIKSKAELRRDAVDEAISAYIQKGHQLTQAEEEKITRDRLHAMLLDMEECGSLILYAHPYMGPDKYMDKVMNDLRGKDGYYLQVGFSQNSVEITCRSWRLQREMWVFFKLYNHVFIVCMFLLWMEGSLLKYLKTDHK